MRVTVGPSGTLIAAAARDEPLPRLLAELLEAVGRCDLGSRPFFYELQGARALLLGSQPIGSPIAFADGQAHRGVVTAGHVSSPGDPTGSEPAPVRLLLETRGGPGIVCLVDLEGSSIVSVAGGDRTFFAELFDLAVAAAIEPVSFNATRRDRGAPLADRTTATFDELVALLEVPRSQTRRPVLVFADERDAGEDLVALLTLARSTPGLGVVVCGAVPASDLVLAAGDPPLAYLRAPVGTPVDTTASRDEPARLEIGILGPTEITGGEGSLSGRPLLTELVVYLAMHPGGASSKTWSAAVWPERLVPAQTIANRLSEARALLGFAPDGLPRMRRSGERHLLADVDTDWARFARLAASPSPEHWRDALDLVRGRPFGDLAEGSWTVLEGFVGEIERAVVECALRLGEHCLGNQDADGASFAARMAIRASPWDERLHRLLMRAADAAGNRSGIEEILQHLALVLEVDGDPLGGVHPETAALYARLSGRRTAGR